MLRRAPSWENPKLSAALLVGGVASALHAPLWTLPLLGAEVVVACVALARPAAVPPGTPRALPCSIYNDQVDPDPNMPPAFLVSELCVWLHVYRITGLFI